MNNKIKFYTLDEIVELMKREERLVFIDNGVDEFVGRYVDIPDIIVDLNRKIGSMDLVVYDYKENFNELLSTYGMFLNKCEDAVRNDIIDRLIALQSNQVKIKNYRLINENDLEKYYEIYENGSSNINM